MRIAHLILAHKNPHQLNYLIEALQHPFFSIFVHVDNKADQSQFEFLLGFPNVQFIVQRTSIYWAGYGTIQATLNGFNEIIPMGFDYINVMSAQDYTIKSTENIYKFFEKNAGTEFITCESVEKEWLEAKGRVTNYHLINYRFPGKYRLEKLINKLLPVRRPPFGFEIVGRANWFALTNAAAKFIFEFQKAHPSYVRYFKYCWGADEFFFATILYNSPFKQTIKSNLTYVDWTEIEEEGHPKILNNEDYDKLIASDKLFARKFDISRDSLVIERLQLSLNKNA